MPRKTMEELEREMREWHDTMHKKGSAVRFIGFSKEKSNPLTPEQLKKVKEFFASAKASPKPATKRKAA